MLYSLILFYMSFVCLSCVIHLYSYVIPMSLLCRPYVTRMYSYVIRMSHICTRMSPVCHSNVLVCHPYFTRMYSYVTRMSVICTPMSPVCTRLSPVCHSSVVCGNKIKFEQKKEHFISKVLLNMCKLNISVAI